MFFFLIGLKYLNESYKSYYFISYYSSMISDTNEQHPPDLSWFATHVLYSYILYLTLQDHSPFSLLWFFSDAGPALADTGARHNPVHVMLYSKIPLSFCPDKNGLPIRRDYYFDALVFFASFCIAVLWQCIYTVKNNPHVNVNVGYFCIVLYCLYNAV